MPQTWGNYTNYKVNISTFMVERAKQKSTGT